MMFLLDLAFALELIAAGVGVTLLIWSLRNSGPGTGIARFFGNFIMITAIGGMFCTSYYGTSYWLRGYFESPVLDISTLPSSN